MDSMTSWVSWWGHSDAMVKGVLISLTLFSATGWAIILHKGRGYRTLLQREQALRTRLEQGAGKIHPEAGVLGAFAVAALKQGDSPDHLREATLAHALREKRQELESGLTLLASIGTSSPFIGLFGTVWGIMHALQGLGTGRALSMEVVAGPVAEALVATGVGLMAAIPAVIGYNLLLRRLRTLMTCAEGNLLRMLAQDHVGEAAEAGAVIPFPATPTSGGKHGRRTP